MEGSLVLSQIHVNWIFILAVQRNWVVIVVM